MRASFGRHDENRVVSTYQVDQMGVWEGTRQKHGNETGTYLRIELPGEQSATLHGELDVAVRAPGDGIRVEHVVALAHGRPRHEP